MMGNKNAPRSIVDPAHALAKAARQPAFDQVAVLKPLIDPKSKLISVCFHTHTHTRTHTHTLTHTHADWSSRNVERMLIGLLPPLSVP